MHTRLHKKSLTSALVIAILGTNTPKTIAVGCTYACFLPCSQVSWHWHYHWGSTGLCILFNWVGLEGRLSATKQQENKTDQIRRFNFPHPHVYSNINLKNCQGEN